MLEILMFLLGDEGASIISGLDAESMIIILSSILAIALFIVSLIAYRRDRRQRLLFVTGAFFLFAVKGFLSVLSDQMMPGATWIDSATNLLDFGILVLFFLGLIKK